MTLRLTDPEWEVFEEIMCACQDVLDGTRRSVNVATARRANAILAVGHYVRPLLLIQKQQRAWESRTEMNE